MSASRIHPRIHRHPISPLGLLGLAVLVSLLPVLQAAGFKEFPIGIYTTGRIEDLPTLHEAGFNIVTGPASKAYLDAAQQAGLKVFASPRTSAGPRFNPSAAKAAISELDSHPALWAWYLIDEPDLNTVPPSQVQLAHRFMKRNGAKKPTAVVFFQGQESQFYASIPDVLMVDRYPVPWMPLENLGQHVELTRLAAGPKKPVIAILQAFDWSYFAQLMPREQGLRAPTKAELRCMSFDALARGANGLFFYTYESGHWKLRTQPELWDDLKTVVAEVRSLTPLFSAQPIWWHRRLTVDDYPKRLNAALQPAISSQMLRVTSASPLMPVGDYLLAVNTTTNAHTLRFHTPKPGLQQLPVLRANRTLIATKGDFTDSIDPLNVRIYGPF